MNNRLIVFAKRPREGEVKTRLASAIGHPMAVKIYSDLLEHTETVLTGIAADPIVYFGNESDPDRFKDYPKRLQEGDTLGQRMHHAIQHAFDEGYQKVVLIGSDLPDMNEKLIDRAFAELDTNDLVIGPAIDGGYYLIGMKHPNEALFDELPWSTSDVLNATLQIVKEQQLSIAMLPRLNDIDTIEDLNQFPNYLKYITDDQVY